MLRHGLGCITFDRNVVWARIVPDNPIAFPPSVVVTRHPSLHGCIHGASQVMQPDSCRKRLLKYREYFV